jgi:hypothetical protein
MWPFRHRSDVAQRPKAWLDGMKCFRSYDLPPGRTWESYRFLVEDIWVEAAVDECVTDDEAERDRLVAAGLEEGYDMRVTDRITGEVITRRASPA